MSERVSRKKTAQFRVILPRPQVVEPARCVELFAREAHRVCRDASLASLIVPPDPLMT